MRLSLLCILICICTSVSASVSWHDGDLASAFAAAEASERNVCVVFVKENCGHCKHLVNQVLPHPVVVAQLDRMVVVRIEMDSHDGQAWSADIGVSSSPSIVVLQAATEVDRIIGVPGHEDLARLLEDYLAGRNTIGDLQQRLQANPNDPEIMLPLARKFGDRQRFDETFALFDHIIEVDPDNESALADDAIYLKGAYLQRQMAMPRDAISVLRAGLDRFPTADKSAFMYYRMALAYRDLNDASGLVIAYTVYRERLPENALIHRSTANMLTKLNVTDKAVQRTAAVAGKMAMELEPQNPKNFRIAATALALAGDNAAACDAIERAIELMPENRDFRRLHAHLLQKREDK
jgi:tetratricopeptide (TPR) repeat protein